jgi:tripartite-type tricarboxylate transporter receptor subunit TctC
MKAIAANETSLLGALLLIALSLLSFDRASAQTWPTKPIKIIVSQAAGGTPDIICRIIADRLSQSLGQQIIVENRPGGGNVVGAQAAAHAAPDGYTFFFATAAALVTNPYTFKSLPYDPLADFVSVSMIAKGPFVVLAHPSMPTKSLPEVIAYEKLHPGTLTFATDGPRNFSGILASWLNKLGGMNILQVPYATMPQGIQDVMAGRVQLIILAVPSAAPHITSGALRPLAVSSLKRFARFANVPAIAETFPGVDFIGWFVLAAPKATPSNVVIRLNREIDEILKNVEISNKLAQVGFFTEGADTPDGTAKYVQSQYEFWGKVTRDIGLQPE